MFLKIAFRTAAALLFSLLAASATAAQDKPSVTFGIFVDGPWERNDEIRRLFESEISDLLRHEFDAQFPADKVVVGNWTSDSTHRSLDRLLADSRIDFVLTLGVMSSDDVCRRSDLSKPVIAPFVVDQELQELPFESGKSGVTNLSYLTFPHSLDRDLTAFLEIVPIHHLGFLMSRPVVDAVPRIADNCRNIAEDKGIEVTPVIVDTSAVEALNRLPEGVDAVYSAPLLHLPPGEFDRYVQALIERKLPSFSLLGQSEVERGILAGLGLEENFSRIARRAALHIQRILLGEDAGSLPVAVTRDKRLTINMRTARAIEVWPPWSVITEADLINDTRIEIERQLTLSQAITEAMERNLDVSVASTRVREGAQDIVRARSILLPQLYGSVLGVILDDDRAAASFGSTAERTLSGSVSLDQLILSEPAWANLAIQRRLQDARVSEWERTRLDVAAETATAFLNLLRARSIESISKSNLQLTRSHLELAQVREAVGSGGQAEVYRWESEIATDRRDVIDANSRRNLAEIQLNRILHRPAEEPFVVEETGLDEPSLLTGDSRLTARIADPWSFKVFRRFVVSEGLRHAPEVRQLDAAIAAQRRALTSSKRVFWLPTIGLSAKVSDRFSEGGAGSGGFVFDVPDSFASILPEFPQADNTDWSIGISATLPIFSGGRRYADLRQSRSALDRLEMERANVADLIEQRIRSALHSFGASYAAIGLTRAAAEAAQHNRELVTDAYARGVVSIIDLLDAQSAARIADEAAANAVYDCLLDLVEVERASGQMTILMSTAERDAWFERLDEFFGAESD